MEYRSSTKREFKDVEKSRIALQESFHRYFPWFLGLLSVLLTGLFYLEPEPPIFWAAFIAMIAAGIFIYSHFIQKPFKRITADFKSQIVSKYMSDYYPTITYAYSQQKKNVDGICSHAKLYTADRYNEEDVIQGELNDTTFYLSEVHLTNQNDDTTSTVFKGLLIHLEFSWREFPTSEIRATHNSIEQWFNKFNKHQEYNFWYKTEDQEKFEQELKSLFPFIKHLGLQYKWLRIKSKKNKLTIMLDTPIKFMDDPPLSPFKPLGEKEYLNQVGKQLNSMFFMVESLTNNLSKTEIEERLELKQIEYRKLHES